MRWQPTTWAAIERAAIKAGLPNPTAYIRDAVEKALARAGQLKLTPEAIRKRDERSRARLEAEREEAERARMSSNVARRVRRVKQNARARAAALATEQGGQS